MQKYLFLILFFTLIGKAVAQTVPNLADVTVCQGTEAIIALPTLASGETEGVVSVSGGAVVAIVGRSIVMSTTGLALGDYDIVYEINDEFGNISDLVKVTVKGVPQGGILTPDVAEICPSDVPAKVTVALSGVQNKPTKYDWITGTAPVYQPLTTSLTSISLDLNSMSDTSYEVSVTPENSCGVGETIMAKINLIQPKVISAKLSATSFCEDTQGLTVTAVKSDSNVVGEKYRFSLNNVWKAYQLDNTVVYPQGQIVDGDIVTVELDLSNVAGCTVADNQAGSLVVDGYKTPELSITSDFSEICEQGSPGEIVITAKLTSKKAREMTIFYQGEIVAIETSETPTVNQVTYVVNQPLQSGIYGATAYNAVCPESAPSAGIGVTVLPAEECIVNGMEDRANSIALVYPNPTTQNSVVYLNGTNNKAHIKLLNTEGQVVLEQNVSNSFSVSNLATGLYYLLIQQGADQKVTKLLIE